LIDELKKGGVMNARTLRVGNYIKAGGFISEVVTISKDEISFVHVRNHTNDILTIPANEIESISLNKNVLIECCGFGSDKRIAAKDMFLQYTPEKDHYIILENAKREPLIHFWDIKALHQLQNLYFALAGIEMVIALDCLVSVIK